MGARWPWQPLKFIAYLNWLQRCGPDRAKKNKASVLLSISLYLVRRRSKYLPFSGGLGSRAA